MLKNSDLEIGDLIKRIGSNGGNIIRHAIYTVRDLDEEFDVMLKEVDGYWCTEKFVKITLL